MLICEGTPVCGGAACGPALFYRRQSTVLEEKTSDKNSELARFREAVGQALVQLKKLRSAALSGAGEEAAAIFDVHCMMLEDPNFTEAVQTGVIERGLGAAAAVQEAGAEIAAQFEALSDAYLRERAADVRDVAHRVTDILLGAESLECLQEPVVLVADDLTPGEAIGLDHTKLLGVLLRGGSANSHTAVLIRALNVPAVFGLGDALPVLADSTEIFVDGDSGTVTLEPDEPARAAFRERLRTKEQERRRLSALVKEECITRDGIRVELLANVGNAGEVAQALQSGACAIGLMRSEYLFLESAACPDEDKQFAAYRAALAAAAGRRVVIRTLDIGADKSADYFNLPKEENPALGCRALRLCFAHPELLHTQLCALYRASAYGELAIMFPMIASEWELDAALAAAGEARRELEERGLPFDAAVPLGMMIETPAAALLSARFARKAAFFSIGTNDLTQYTLAADRQNPAAARYYSQKHPAVLHLIELTVKNAAVLGVPVAICGELATDTSTVPRLLALGVRKLSLPPTCIPAVLAAVRETNVSAVKSAWKNEI